MNNNEIKIGSALYYVQEMINELNQNGEYRVKWEWALSILKDLAFNAARIEWKFGRNDDGSLRDWTEWRELRDDIEKSGIELRKKSRH